MKETTKKKKTISIIIFIVGIITFITGVAFLVIGLLNTNKAADADYLVSAKTWTLENESGVIWQFTEPGKGTLTTNNHQNDYDFTWTLEDGKLKITTDWLYDLENEYEYSLNQGNGTLTLKDNDKEVHFRADF